MSPALFLLAATAGAPPAPDLKLPPGFTAKLYADNPLAPDVYTMTIDDAGRVLIAGRGYVRALVDDDNDGTADRAVDLIDGLKEGPMGLLAEGDSLFVVSDGGLKRYRSYNGRDKLKGPAELLLALKTGGEHDAHALRRGPDGWLYLLCGNMAGVKTATATDRRSPVRDPVAGALLRLSPDFSTVEIVADGFRNPYSFDFNPDGESLTYDSDNERCVGLPWYEGCRFYHVVPGGNYGWRAPQRSQTWRKPPYFPDVVRPIADLGRGSPTGVACYRHTQFRAKYRGGFFLADWTFGRIYFVPLTPSGSTYRGTPEVFAEATGTSGFAPTALAVHPKTGELFVSIGGRGTRGGVYRIAFDKGDANPKPLPMANRSLDYDNESATQWLKDALANDIRKRRESLDLIWRHRDKGFHPDAIAKVVRPNLDHPDALVRAAAGRVALPFAITGRKDDLLQARLTLALASVESDPDWALAVALAVLDNPNAKDEELIAALRLVHLAHGDLTAKAAVGTAWEGYTLRDPVPEAQARPIYERLAKLIAAANRSRELELEIARMVAVLGGAHGHLARRATFRKIGTDTAEADDFHYLLALAGASNGSPAVDSNALAAALIDLLKKVKSQGVTVDRHWPLRLDELLARMARSWTDLGTAMLEQDAFGAPEHVAFVKSLNLNRAAAAKRFVARAQADKNYAWTPAVVALLAELLRDRVNDLLPALWDRPGLEDAVLRVLARDPRATDRPKFVAGLKALDADIVRLSAAALATLPAADAAGVCVAATRALRRFPDEKPNAAARVALVTLLQKHSGEKLGADAKVWSEWLVKHHPGAAKALDANDGFDAAAWRTRLAGIAWDKGDAARGRAAFAKATCAACHDGGRAVGPSLLGVGKRFGRADLLTAILQPNKDVPPRYRPTRVTTLDEKSYTGIVVYEAADGIILQTGIDTTVRVAGANIAGKKLVDVSLMPADLLDKLRDDEIADLLAYLAALK